MENIKSTTELKNAIQSLKAEKAFQELLLKERISLAYDSLKPANILKNTLNDIATSPHLLDNILSTGMGLATGFVARKIVVGAQGGFIKKLIGSILQFGVTNIVAQNSGKIQSIGQYIFQHIRSRKKINQNKL
jgi:hypothetical protein